MYKGFMDFKDKSKYLGTNFLIIEIFRDISNLRHVVFLRFKCTCCFLIIFPTGNACMPVYYISHWLQLPRISFEEYVPLYGGRYTRIDLCKETDFQVLLNPMTNRVKLRMFYLIPAISRLYRLFLQIIINDLWKTVLLNLMFIFA